MSVVECIVCGEAARWAGTAYRCGYCGHPICSDHRLPENHECTGELLPTGNTAKGREPKPVDPDSLQTVGGTPEDVGASGPDVALDGSLVESESEQTDDSAGESWWKRLLPW
jgi:hypothetical protein